jgi:aryl-alcohol dehydrogenase-like predicted oxidoreductase
MARKAARSTDQGGVMERRKLGDTGVEVSLVGLGTMTWGQQNTREEAFAQLDLALERGVNLIDAAEMYPVPPRAETAHRTEAILGEWLAARGRRGEVVLATKVTGRSPMPWIRGGPRLSRAQIREAIEGSLRRLRTEYVDLYQLHWPDRATNFFGQLGYTHPESDDSVPIEETLAACAELVAEGKVRHVGISNETPWGVMKYLEVGAREGQTRVASIQNPYSLLNRSFEVGLAEMAIKERVGLLAYSPLAFGVLSGKYAGGARPEGARLTLFGDHFTRYLKPMAVKATERYVALAREAGLDPAQMALAFVHSRPFLTSTLVGATSIAQLEANLASAELRLGPDLLRAIDAIHAEISNPAP